MKNITLKLILFIYINTICLISFSQTFIAYPRYDKTNTIVIKWDGVIGWSKIEISKGSTILATVAAISTGEYADVGVTPDEWQSYSIVGIIGTSRINAKTVMSVINSNILWPIDDGSDDVMTNFGEPSWNSWCFHEGIDIIGANKAIAAVRGGEVIHINNTSVGTILTIKVDIGSSNFEYDSYLHLKDLPVLSIGMSCTPGMILGYIKDDYYIPQFCHLHFSKLNDWNSALNTDGVFPDGHSFCNPLINFLPKTNPNSKAPSIQSDPSTTSFPSFVLKQSKVYIDPAINEPAWDNVSILAAATDLMSTSLTHRQGIYSLGYYIENISGNGSSVKTSSDPYYLVEYNNNFFQTAGLNAHNGTNGPITRNFWGIIDNNNDPIAVEVVTSSGGIIKHPQHYIITNASLSKSMPNAGQRLSASTNEFWKTRASIGSGTKDNGSNASDAPINKLAKFKDGEYKVHVIMSDQVNNVDEARNVIVDNFRPYIEKVEIKSGTTTIYSGEWEWNASAGLKYIPNGKYYSSDPIDGIITSASNNDDIVIYVTTSEALKELTLSDIKSLNANSFKSGISLPLTATYINTEKTQWQFSISKSNFKTDGSTNGRYILEFKGKDKLGNEIESFSPSKTSYSSTEIPIRTGKTTWSVTPHTSQGYDNMHCFDLGSGNTNTSTVSISADKPIVAVNSDVNFTAVLLGNSFDPSLYTYKWTFKDGNTIVKTLTQTGTNKLTTQFGTNALISAEVNVIQNVVNIGYSLKKEIVNVGSVFQPIIGINKTKATIDETLDLSASVTGGSGNYTYYWSFGNGNTSTFKSTTTNYQTTGVKTISLTVSDGTTSKTVTEDITITDIPQLQVDFQLGADPYNTSIKPNDLIQFISNVEGAAGMVTYWWDFGDNTSTSDGSRIMPMPQHTYSTEGYYTVTLKVIADNGTRIVSHTYKVTKLGNLDATFTSSSSSTSPYTVSFTLNSNIDCYAYLLYGDGQSSKVFHVSPNLPANVNHTYNETGTTKDVFLMVSYNGTWNMAYTNKITINGPLYEPKVYISLYEEGPTNAEGNNNVNFNRPWVSTSFLDYTKIGEYWNVNHFIKPGSPLYNSGKEERYYFDYSWSAAHDNVSLTGFFNAGASSEPYQYLNVNDPEVVKHFSNYEPFVCDLTLTVYYKEKIAPFATKSYQAKRQVVLYPPIHTEIKDNYTACEGSSFEILPKVTGGMPPYSYTWSDGTSEFNDSYLTCNVGAVAKNYTLTIRDGRMKINDIPMYKKSFSVTPSALTVNAGSDIKICGLNTLGTLSGTVSGGSGKYYYNWSPSNNLSSSFKVNTNVASSNSGTIQYTLNVSDQYGCKANDKVNVTVYDAVMAQLDNKTVLDCNETRTLTPNILGGSGNCSYLWSNGSKTKDLNVNAKSPLNLTFTATDLISGCVSNTTSTYILSICSNLTTNKKIVRGGNSYKVTIPITSSPGKVSYSAVSNNDWIVITDGQNGYTGNFIKIELQKNPLTVNRTGKIVISSSEALNSPYEIEITQTLDEIIKTPSEYTNIQDAINNAPDGAKIEVGEGYYGDIIFDGSKTISVKSTGCPANTVIGAVTFTNKDKSTLQGFTVTNESDGPGILITGYSSPNLYDLIIIGNYNTSWGGGIYINNSSGNLINSIISGNNASFGGGINNLGGTLNMSNVLITKNKVNDSWDNYIHNIQGIGEGIESSGNIYMRNVTIANNYSNSDWTSVDAGLAKLGGLSLQHANVQIVNSIIREKIGIVGDNDDISTINIQYSDIKNGQSNITAPVTLTYLNNYNVDPIFESNFNLSAGSPCVDKGDPSLGNIDKNGTRADLGFTGGRGIYSQSFNFCKQNPIPESSYKNILISNGCSNPTTYSSGENANFVATGSIRIKSGFKASAGSNLSFKIHPYYNEPFQYDDRCDFINSITQASIYSDSIEKSPAKKQLKPKEFKVYLYPNPAHDNLTIQFNKEFEGIAKVEIIDALGKIVKRAKYDLTVNDMNITELAKGTYQLKTIYGQFVIVKMFVKQ